MRITFVTVNYAPSVGGAQLLVRRLAEGLATLGHDVEVLTTDGMLPPAGRAPGHVDLPDGPINGVDVRRFRSSRRVQGAVLLAVRIARRLGRPERPGLPTGARFGPMSIGMARAALGAARRSDVVIGVSVPFLTVSGSQWACRFGRARHVTLPLLHLPTGTPLPRQVRALRRSDHCVAATAFERDWMVAQGVAPDAVTVVPPGCDPDAFPDLGAPAARELLGLPAGTTIGYVGRLAVHKGIDLFLAALPELWRRRPDLNVVIAGARTGWPGWDDALAAAVDAGGERLVVRESFSDQDKPLVYTALDVVVFPSREESFGLVTIEAWCARRPVIAPDIGAVRCVVREGVDGRLVPPGDADAVVEAVEALLADPVAALAMGEAGRHRAETEYRWSAVIGQWDAMLRAMGPLEGSGRRLPTEVD